MDDRARRDRRAPRAVRVGPRAGEAPARVPDLPSHRLNDHALGKDHAVQHVRLGRTGLQVSRICLGTMTFGLQVDEPVELRDPRPRGRQGHHVPRHRRRLSARRRPHHRGPHRGDRRQVAEGQARPVRRRDQVLRADGPEPVGHGQQPAPHHGFDRRVAAAAADRLHRPLPAALRRSRRAARGVARRARTTSCAWARSATSAARTTSRTGSRCAVGKSESLGIARFDSVQPRYNLLFREFERELFPLCLEEGIGVIPYNPIAGGMLSGKHDRSKPPEEGTRFTLGNAARTYQDRYWHDNVFDTVDELVKVADERGHPAADARGRVDAADTPRSRRRSSARAGPSSSTRPAPRSTPSSSPTCSRPSTSSPPPTAEATRRVDGRAASPRVARWRHMVVTVGPLSGIENSPRGSKPSRP